MTDGIDLVDLLKDFPARSKGRACIVLTHDFASQKQWAGELARLTTFRHIDLLDLLVSDAELSARLQDISVDRLFDLLADYTDTPVLIISGLECLKATWSGLPSAGEEFASRVETWRGTPALLFIMQYDKALAERDFTRYPQYAFVIDQRETLKL